MMVTARRNRTAGFTLIEVLLTVSLIAMLSTLFVINIGALLRDGELETLENEYWRAVDAARTGAVFRQSPHFIEWDDKARSFVVSSSGVTERFHVDTKAFGDVDVAVRFEEIAPENSYVLIRGELVSRRDIATVGFYPDGTCSPYVVSMTIGDFETSFQMDPWTGVQLVDPEEGHAGI
ncbi:prepilin-type N-terminal cleavage/methylation domain-containing protein [Pelagicoccus sp. SDUM812003]|uniref:prepilin-type N-terminal cleavage/methylation domain-containing protein n=1 Tax=Pelagicoccus sp. SDUM812003 TaxID=3041267 RepID=UPI00280C9CDB|nr:prepilin-type N-terminal cleavage/methylation domain-containing protein [Pelagicoccus sp. SDUM812003]MDQ8202960.1 prepilin-type N-terminal cleavage/methylation domain-containing protein [Pelagicoccus sp. SDUM812003]